MNRPEALFERKILTTWGKNPDVLLCKNEVGKGYTASAVNKAVAILEDAFGPMPPAARAELRRGFVTYGLDVGSPDLALWVAGESALVELKSNTGQLSEDQLRWHAAARAKGVRIATVRTEEGFAEVVERLRAMARARRGEDR